jgi:peptidoglycan hydrolase-like protein with peptidoglycan-binding domain
MDFSKITSLVLSLLGKRQELVSIIQDAISLFNRVKTLLPAFETQLSEITKGEEGQTAQSSPMSITWLQESLNKLVPGAKLTVDGKYGQGTQDVVKKFQQQHGLTPDGWAGVQTQAAIVDALE